MYLATMLLMVCKAFLGFVVTASFATATSTTAGVGKFNGYWGQSGHDRLRDRCSEGADYITLSFVNVSPENGNGTGYPGTNFGDHCGASYFHNNGQTSRLCSDCPLIAEDISFCHANGVKILLNIGGVWSLSSNYTVSTANNGRYFAQFLWKAFGPPDKGWSGPRPFGQAAVDGFNFDLELKGIDNAPYISMVSMFRALNSSMLITASPECPTTAGWFKMRGLIAEAQLDALFIQFYNNPVCDYIEGAAAGDRFNFDEWEKVITASKQNQDASLYIGLVANHSNAAYIPPDLLGAIIRKYQHRPHFGGIALWDMYQGSVNEVHGRSYNEWVRCILKTSCHSVSTATKSSSKHSPALSTADSKSTSPRNTLKSGAASMTEVEVASCFAGLAAAAAVAISRCYMEPCLSSWL